MGHGNGHQTASEGMGMKNERIQLPLTEVEQEIFDERLAICMEDGLVSQATAEILAMDSVRQYRERNGD